MCRKILLSLVTLAATLIFAGCTTGATYSTGDSSWATTAGGGSKATGYSPVNTVAETQADVVTAALSLVGTDKLRINDRTFRSDCSGTILAIYYKAGVDLEPAFARETGNGVRRLYEISQNVSNRRRRTLGDGPAPGDLIFWDNTWDRNENGRWDDELTHAGIVVSVSPDGSIEYVHYHYREGIVVQRMNLRYPDDPERNDAMRMRGQRDPRRDLWLSSHLFREAGSPYLATIP